MIYFFCEGLRKRLCFIYVTLEWLVFGCATVWGCCYFLTSIELLLTFTNLFPPLFFFLLAMASFINSKASLTHSSLLFAYNPKYSFTSGEEFKIYWKLNISFLLKNYQTFCLSFFDMFWFYYFSIICFLSSTI